MAAEIVYIGYRGIKGTTEIQGGTIHVRSFLTNPAAMVTQNNI